MLMFRLCRCKDSTLRPGRVPEVATIMSVAPPMSGSYPRLRQDFRSKSWHDGGAS